MRMPCVVVVLAFGLVGCQRPDANSPSNNGSETETTEADSPDNKPLEYWAKALRAEDDARGKAAATMLAMRAAKGEPGVPILVDALKDPDEKVRQRAAGALPSIGDEAVPALAQAVRQPEGGEAALGVLRRMNRDAVMPQLARLLDDPEARVRLMVLKALRDLGLGSASPAATAVARRISDPDPEVQRLALEILGKVGAAPADVPVLTDLLVRTPPPPVALRVMILQTIARIGPGAKSAPKLLLPVLKSDPEADVRAGAAAALAKVAGPGDPEVVPALQAALTDPEPAVRAEAVGALGAVVGRADETTVKYLPDVTTAARDKVAAVRFRAAQVLDLWALPASLPIVAELLKDTDPATRGRAATALGGLKKAAAPLIEEALRSQYPEVRRGALQALDNSTPEVVAKAVPILNELLSSPEVAQRRETAEYIGKFGPSAGQAAPALAKLVADPNPEVRKASVTALGFLGKAGVPGLTTALKSKDEELRLLAIRTLREPKEDAAAAGPALAELLRDPNPNLQAEAVLTLTEIAPEDPGVARAVAQLARTKEQRDICLSALKKMGGAGAGALAGLLAELKDQKNANTLVQSSLMAMKEIGKPAIPSLIQILKDAGQPRYARELAAKNLGEVGDSSAVDALNDATKDPDMRISTAARDALAKIR